MASTLYPEKSGQLHVQDEGTDLGVFKSMNFVGAGVVATQDGANDRWIVTIVGGAAVGSTFITQATEATLTGSRKLTAPAAGITLVDGGALGDLTITLANDLAAVEGLAGSGISARTAVDTWALRSLAQPAAGITITNPAGTAGNPTFALANDLAAVEGLAASGMAARTGVDTWAVRTLTQPAAGFTITNPAGTAGDPTFVLANDLNALEGLSASGFAARTGADTWSVRTLTQPAAGMTITNPAGTLGDPTFALANDLAGIEGLATTGLSTRTGDGTWVTRSIAVADVNHLTVANADGVAGNPTLAIGPAVILRDGSVAFTGKETFVTPATSAAFKLLSSGTDPGAVVAGDVWRTGETLKYVGASITYWLPGQVREVTSGAFTILTDDYEIHADTTTADATTTLPQASTCPKRHLKFKKSVIANLITITAFAGDTIDAAATYTVASGSKGYVTLTAPVTGVDWKVT